MASFGDSPGIPHRTMQVSRPAGLSPVRGTELPASMGIPAWSSHAYADAGHRTRITTVTGSYARRITPRRHVQSPRPESNRRPPDSKSGVPRQRRLRGCTSLSLSLCGNVPGVPGALSAHGTVRSSCCRERTESKPPRALSSAPAHCWWTEQSLDECRRQSRVPSPGTGSPCGGQVMRV
jgi:hypothetical protein